MWTQFDADQFDPDQLDQVDPEYVCSVNAAF